MEKAGYLPMCYTYQEALDSINEGKTKSPQSGETSNIIQIMAAEDGSRNISYMKDYKNVIIHDREITIDDRKLHLEDKFAQYLSKQVCTTLISANNERP